MFCSRCGKKLDDDVRFCPYCGNEITIHENAMEDTPKIEKIKFTIGSCEYSYDKRFNEYSLLRIAFDDMATAITDDFVREIASYKDMESLIKGVPFKAEKCIVAMSENVVNTLVNEKIYGCSVESFIEKYYFNYMNFDDFFSQIEDKYMQIICEKNQLLQYRELKKASRSKFRGGGFGITGAISGAVKASMLNTGMDFMRGIGDSVSASIDRSKINRKLKELFENPETKKTLVDGMYACLFNSIIGFTEECKEYGIYYKPDLDAKASKIYYDNAINLKSSEEQIGLLLKSIEMYPYALQSYNFLLDTYPGYNGEIIDLTKFFYMEEKILWNYGNGLLKVFKKMENESENSLEDYMIKFETLWGIKQYIQGFEKHCSDEVKRKYLQEAIDYYWKLAEFYEIRRRTVGVNVYGSYEEAKRIIEYGG